jgi:alanine racemase
LVLVLTDLMHYSSYIELSKKALEKNIRFLRKRIGSSPVFCSVIKGNAYGHRIRDFVPLATQCGLRYFAVSSAEEAAEAGRHATADSRIMIMGYIDDADIEWAIREGISFYVFDLGRLEAARAAALATGLAARVHLEIETGLNRTGLDREEVERAAEMLKRNAGLLVLEGVCTHYAGAESIGNYVRIKNQILRFEETISVLERHGINIPLRHTACSAAALRYPETIMDLVRFGIAQYGFWPSKETRIEYALACRERGKVHIQNPLKAVLTWKSRIMSIRKVDTGQYVGYGSIYQTSRTQRIATIPVGYSHGFARDLSNLGHVLVRGKRAPVVGFVSMNATTIDVSHIPEARKGDEVVLIGRQGKNEISISSFSDMSRKLNYEVLVRIPSEIPRVIVN